MVWIPEHKIPKESAVIDWSKPIEAVGKDGTYKASVIRTIASSTEVSFDPTEWETFVLWSNQEGGCGDPNWTIRNVQPKTIPVDAKVWERVVGLVERISTTTRPLPGGYVDQARSIHALIKPVDVDLVEAERLADGIEYDNVGDVSHYQIVQAIAGAIRRGRELEREGR